MKISVLKNNYFFITKVIIFCISVFFSASAQGQMLTIQETDDLYNNAEKLVEEGDVIMREFIITQQAQKYDAGLELYDRADSIYAALLKYGTASESMASLMGVLVEANQTLLSSKKTLIDKESIMAEKPEDRTKKVKFNGEKYKLSKSSKISFDMLEAKK